MKQLTIEELISEIKEKVPSARTVEAVYLFDEPETIDDFQEMRRPIGWAGEVMSYRGYYDELAIDIESEPRTSCEIVGDLQDAIGKTFTGYKGGEYEMCKHTPVWVSRYGQCDQYAVIGVQEDPNDWGNALLICAEMEI